jgi:hypothetical protein
MPYDLESADPRKVDVPEGVSGEWEVKKFEVKEGVGTLRAALAGRPVRTGVYTLLQSKADGLFMTDTPAEYRDAAGFINWAEGDVLISGLGLGMVIKALLKKPNVRSITVIELEPDVIKLVAPSYPDPRVRIICADAYTWKPDRKFDWAWHDIWADISTDDLPLMARITRHYQRAMTARDRQQCWGREILRNSRYR